MAPEAPTPQRLTRALGVPGAVLMGLGSIVGTGVFVSLGLAAGLAGPSMLLALVLAAALASFNGLSSAQLAAHQPVSGGTYAYAGALLGPGWGFTAGLLFLAAKGASAATAALGLAGYLLALLGVDAPVLPVAFALVAALTALVYSGVRRSNTANVLIVGFTLGVLGLLGVLGGWQALGATDALRPVLPEPAAVPGFLEATALLFVAYTGYGRIATLGEEVVEPRRTIPRAVVAALGVVLLLYVAVAVAALGALGAEAYAQMTVATAAPLEAAAHALGHPWLASLLALAAITALAGVLLNLVLGLSRVLLAMGRSGDAPAVLGRVDESGTTPGPAVLATGAGIAVLVLWGDVRVTWTFSAFTVLGYYALTNLAALRLPARARMFPRWTAWVGLLGCLVLVPFIEPWIWALGLGVLAVGHLLRVSVGC